MLSPVSYEAGFFLPNLVILMKEGSPQETPQSIATINHQPSTINHQPTTNNQQPTTNNQKPATFIGRVPTGRAFGYIFYYALLHKRIPPLSLTLLVS